MAYYYVLAGGTKTTGSLTKQTGSFASLGASNYYASMSTALTGGASSGDIICVSDTHAETPTDFVVSGPTSGDALTVLSVDASNCDTEKTAISAQGTASDDIILSGRLLLRGLYLKSSDDTLCNSSANILMEKCTIEVTGTVDRLLSLYADGTSVVCIDCNFVGVSTSTFSVTNGSYLKLFGGSVSGITSHFLTAGFNNGGGFVEIIGTDLSSITGYIIDSVGGVGSADDTMQIDIRGCKLNASYSGFIEESIQNYSHKLNASNCSTTSASAEYQFHYERMYGYINQQDDAGIHRDESTAFPSGEKISAHCVTSSTATPAKPFYCELPSRYAEISTATDTLRVYLASTTSLTDADVWIDAVYPDGTNNHLYNFISTKPVNILATGTALTTDSGSTWKDGASDLTGYNEYYIDIDTSGNAGADCAPELRLTVAKASAVIYFDTSIGVI